MPNEGRREGLIFGNEEKEKKLRPKRILGAYKQSHILIFKQKMNTSNTKQRRRKSTISVQFFISHHDIQMKRRILAKQRSSVRRVSETDQNSFILIPNLSS
jgi:hypothetical protein